ncbi:MAG TPA: NACHT domain-containing protein [Ktedonobacteraceae bacterium]|nr:NACHT domain-containing protein [Ktedonobacteraceae bacterium]
MSQFNQSSQQVDFQFIAGQNLSIFQPPVHLTDLQRKINRARMIQRVQMIWIDDVLESSLQGTVPITPRMQLQPDAIQTPWQFVVQRVSREGSMLPSGTRIGWVYDRANGEILILGEPGSGKTILLLELTRDLLERVQGDESQPVPVVFMLSTWANIHRPLAEWLISELHLRYHIPLPLAKPWVEEEQILPLLDGLDEVPANYRAACVEAINAYRRAHGLHPTVVSCRLADYQVLPVRLELNTAISVQLLSPQEITSSLASSDQRLMPLQHVLQEDEELQALASTPLLLNILTTTYQNSSEGEIPRQGIQSEQLFTAYVKQAITRHHSDTFSTHPEAMHWLTNLARQMRHHNLSVFYIEQLQRDWLTSDKMRCVYDWVAVRLPGIVIAILTYFVIWTLFQTFSLTLSNIVWPIVVGGLLGSILAASSSRATQQFERQGQDIPQKHPLRLIGTAVIIAFVGGLCGWLIDGRQSAEEAVRSDAHLIAFLYLTKFRAVDTHYRFSVEQHYIEEYHANYNLIFGLSYGLMNGLVYFFLGIIFLLLAEKGKLRPSFSQSSSPRNMWLRQLFGYPPVLMGLLMAVGDLLSNGISYGIGKAQGYALVLRDFRLDSVREVGMLAREGLRIGLSTGLSTGLVNGFIFGLTTILLSTLLVGKSDTIQPIDHIVWSFRNLRSNLFSKRLGKMVLQLALLSGAVVGVSRGIKDGMLETVSGWVGGFTSGLGSGSVFSLALGLMYWLLLGFFRSVSPETIDEQHRFTPNQGIHRSASNGLILATVTAIIRQLAE